MSVVSIDKAQGALLAWSCVANVGKFTTINRALNSPRQRFKYYPLNKSDTLSDLFCLLQPDMGFMSHGV